MKTRAEIYERSNSIETVDLSRFAKSYYKKLLNASETKTDRQKAASSLVDYLCNKYKINGVQVVVTDKKRPQRRERRSKVTFLGFYVPGTKTIIVYNKTAVKSQTVAIKTFIDVLLHEFIHHYDYEYLKLGRSYHTAGFYKRISDLKNKLL